MCKKIQGGYGYSEFTQEKLKKALCLIESSRQNRINQQKQIDEFIDEFFELLDVVVCFDMVVKSHIYLFYLSLFDDPCSNPSRLGFSANV